MKYCSKLHCSGVGNHYWITREKSSMDQLLHPAPLAHLHAKKTLMTSWDEHFQFENLTRTKRNMLQQAPLQRRSFSLVNGELIREMRHKTEVP